jgi:inosine-uridine nucleoside N-ribohydrolase
MEKISIILDTDIGSDIDDAVALAYLLKQPQCDLLGVTTVTGEPDWRASLADAVCKAGGRNDIPVHVGAELPLIIGQMQPEARQKAALSERWPHRTFDKTNTAIEFLRETIHARPGEITLLTIGPLTNIGLLFALDRTIPSKLKRLVMMGGKFYPAGPTWPKTWGDCYAEWNIRCDPHAAQIVFASDVPEIVAVGLDVTTQVMKDADECRQRFLAAGGALELVAAMAEVWYQHAKAITFHDPLAAALIFDESLCELDAQHVEVELAEGERNGETKWDPASSEPKVHKLAKTVNAEAFFEHYFSTVGG